MSVVAIFDPGADHEAGFGLRRPVAAVTEHAFQGGPERLGGGVESQASPTDPIEGRISSSARCSVSLSDVYLTRHESGG